MRKDTQAHGMRVMWRALLAGGLLASVVLAGCSTANGTPTGNGGNGATHALATTAPTLTPTPQATVSPSQVAQACSGGASDYSQIPVYLASDLYIYAILSGLTFPAHKMPDGVPLKPFKLNGTDTVSLNNQLPLSPLVNPFFGAKNPYSAGYIIGVCDAASTAHTIQGVTVQIASFTSYTGTLNSWQSCDGWYTDGQANGHACGGSFVAGELLAAAFSPTAGEGTTLPATFIGAGRIGTNPLPLTLQPGHSLDMNVALTPPTVTGYYQFAFSVKADGANSPFITDPEIFLLDSSAHKWSGAACQTTAMKAQIPNDGGSYICPE